MDKFAEVYKVEASELLCELEDSILELEHSPNQSGMIERAFRALHTIKGSGAMAGFADIAAFTHEMENAFELVRQGKLAITSDLVDKVLAARDVIRWMLDGGSDEDEQRASQAREIVEAFKKLLPTADGNEAPVPDVSQTSQEMTGECVTYEILFRPHPEIFTRGSNPLLLLDELRQLGDCRVVAHPEEIPGLEELNPEQCYTRWEVNLATCAGMNAIRDVFIFIEDECELKITAMDDSPLKSPQCPDSDIPNGPAEKNHVRELRPGSQQEEMASSIRVHTAKLDTLVDLVGELVAVQAGLSQIASCNSIPGLRSIAEQVARLTSELRDGAMAIRMLPIGTTFHNFRRLVRDLSRELGKDVVLTTSGEETELDKTLIERLNDPLVHLIRNSIDHGIESSEARMAAGKPARGTVHLAALHSGADVLIRITDDGAGLDEEGVRKKAVEKGLIAPDARLSRQELFSLIFAPGFSTAAAITNISGRGVGMDVVKKSIESLRGTIDIDSEKAKGTVVTLRLPLTLAIIDGLLVKIGERFFVLPLSMVEACVELSREDVAKAHGRHMALIRKELVPYVRLRDRFSIGGEVPPIEQMVVTRIAAEKIGFVVDKVMGEHQTVVKSLGRMYRNVEGVSGATIMGDGGVALVVDVPGLVERFESQA
jgi:two-component system chemotaxis sensor kinase CheA